MESNAIFYAIFFFILFICNTIFIGGIADQAQYGPRVCLLYVDNYRLDSGLNAYIFNANSTACGAGIGIGIVSLFVGLAMSAFIGFYIYKGYDIQPKIVSILAITSLVMGSIMLVMASVTSAGINQTCSQFTSVTKSSCATVFSNGFFANDPNSRYSKNLGTVAAASGAAWMVVLCWMIFGGFNAYKYRKHTNRWW